jgi:hypothetical protein
MTTVAIDTSVDLPEPDAVWLRAGPADRRARRARHAQRATPAAAMRLRE